VLEHEITHCPDRQITKKRVPAAVRCKAARGAKPGQTKSDGLRVDEARRAMRRFFVGLETGLPITSPPVDREF
jgi:hypothetical protein